MISELRSQAASANRARSRRPKTPAGKLRSSANPLRHGLLARTVILEDVNGNTLPGLLAAMAFRASGGQSRCLHLVNRYESRFERQYPRFLALLLKRNAVPPRENSFCGTNPASY